MLYAAFAMPRHAASLLPLQRAAADTILMPPYIPLCSRAPYARRHHQYTRMSYAIAAALRFFRFAPLRYAFSEDILKMLLPLLRCYQLQRDATRLVRWRVAASYAAIACSILPYYVAAGLML